MNACVVFLRLTQSLHWWRDISNHHSSPSAYSVPSRMPNPHYLWRKPRGIRRRTVSEDWERISTRPGLLEAWLVLTSVKYHGNLYILIPPNQRLALSRLRATGPSTLSEPDLNWHREEILSNWERSTCSRIHDNKASDVPSWRTKVPVSNRPQATASTIQQPNSETATTHWKTRPENAEPWLRNDSHPL